MLGWGANWGREYHKVTSFHGQFIHHQKEFNAKGTKSEDDLIAYRKNLIELRNSVCAQKHFATTQRQGKCSKECRPLFFMSSFAAKFDLELAKLEQEIDAVNAMYFRRTLDKAIATANDENRKVVEWIKNWLPLTENGITERNVIKADCDAKMPLAVERFDTNFLREELQKLIQSPQITFPDNLTAKYDKWVNAKTVLPQNEREQNVSDIQRLMQEAKVSVENKHFETLLANLNGIVEKFPDDIQKQLDAWKKHKTSLAESDRAAKNARIQTAYKEAARRVFEFHLAKQKKAITQFASQDVAGLQKLVSDFVAFRKVPVIDVDSETVERNYNELENILIGVVEAFIDARQKDAQKKLMESDVYQEPRYAKETKENVCSLFSHEIKMRLIARIDQHISSGRQEWERAQEQVVNDFIRRIQNSSAGDCLDQYKPFSLENKNNPYLSKAENTVIDIVEREFKRDLEKFDFSESAYRALNELAIKIRATTSNKLQKSRLYRFSNSYISMMGASHRINITDIQVYSSNGGSYIENCSYRIGSSFRGLIGDLSWDEEERATFRNNWQSLPFFSPPINESCEPWDSFVFRANVWRNEPGPDPDLGYYSLTLNPGRQNQACFEGYLGAGVSIRIYYSINYKTINEILSEVK